MLIVKSGISLDDLISTIVKSGSHRSETFYTKHDQRFSSTRKGRKIHMGLSRHFCLRAKTISYNDRRMTRGQTTSSLGGTANFGLLLPYFILKIFIAVFPKTITPSMDC